MADPFLFAHIVSTDVYTLSGRVPVSIRDQLVRAQYLVDRLFSLGHLSAGKQLAVIGCGAAGATAAILAARRDVNVQLFEASKSPFRVQRACTRRWIDPGQYDWPASHAEAAQWPIEGLNEKKVPLGFEAGPSSKIAAKWTTILNKQRLSKNGNLTAHFGAYLLKYPKRLTGSTGPTIEVEYEKSARQYAAKFDLVVIARGIASERTEVDFRDTNGTLRRFEGPLFWSDDNLEAADFGFGAQLQRSLLVSGSGDGALQDYIRTVSGQNSAIALLNTFRGTDGMSGVPGDVRRVIYEAEQEAQRELVWNNRKEQDHAPLLKLHMAYLKAVDEWVLQTTLWKNVVKSLRLQTNGRDVKKVCLYHPCSHFSQSYALNHLLALVLSRYIFDQYGVVTIEGNTSIVSVDAPLVRGRYSHVCNKGCWRETHEVHLRPAVTCLSSSNGSTLTRKLFDGVVVRHGLHQHTSAALRRNILPLHVS